MIFAFWVEDEDKLNARHIGDEHVKSLLVDNIDKRYIKADEPVKLSGSKDYAKLLSCYESTLPSQTNSCALCNTKSQGLQNVLAAKLWYNLERFVFE